MDDTIFALSSGAPPAAIGIIRISGSQSGAALAALAGKLPPARSPRVRTLRDRTGTVLDTTLVLWFSGPQTATGEDLAEIHCHGGRAVIAAISRSLADMDGLRAAEPGEFTRRAFANGRMDLAEAEGLADLLAAETELQRQGALLSACGSLSQQIEEWRSRILGLAAAVEAVIDFADEDDVAGLPPGLTDETADLVAEIRRVAGRPEAERLRDGVRVILAGPPNAGKSSLFNALLADDAAIVTPEAGTTRDVLERSVGIAGVPFVLVDTAGMRKEGAGVIEEMGIQRARRAVESGQIVLWLGEPVEAPDGSIIVASKSDLGSADQGPADVKVSSVTGQGMDLLVDMIVERGKAALPPVDRIAFNRRQKECALAAADDLAQLDISGDLLIAAERVRSARRALDRLVGRDSTEEMLDALFGRFCIGK